MKKEWMIFTFVLLFIAGIGIGVLYSNHANRTETVIATDSAVACRTAEGLLTGQLEQYREESASPSVHLERAKIYADLSDQGCAENSDEYRKLAMKEIGISRALNDAARKTADEVREIIDEYNRVDIKAEVDKALDKAKQLTDPAIDFMLQVEKVIKED